MSLKQHIPGRILRYTSLLLLAVSNQVLSADVAVLYEGTDFTGASWSVPVGDYDTTDLNASSIGNDAISSLTVTSGYAVQVCRNSFADVGDCETFSSSSASLGSLDNAASSIRVFEDSNTQLTLVDQFPKDLQLYPRDTDTNTAPVTVSGVLGLDSTAAVLNVYRDGTLWNSWSHDKSTSVNFQFELELPAELVDYKFELLTINDSTTETVVASAESVVAGDVFVINGQSNAVAGLYSIAGPGTQDASHYIRTYGGWGTDTWNDNDDWHVVQAECQPRTQPLACVGRMGLRVAADLLANVQIPIAVINQSRGNQSISYFAANAKDLNDLTSNYGQLLSRLQNGGIVDNIRALLWFQGESDRTDNKAHFKQFSALFDRWQTQYHSVEQYYVFQIRHTCDPSDEEFGLGSQISDFQRKFANARSNVTPVSTTGLDGHDGCHFRYEGGYQQMGDNVARIIRRELYGENLDNADAPDIVSASRFDDTTLELTFTDGNTLVADDGFEALFEVRDRKDNIYNITAGVVLNGTIVRLTMETPVEDDDELYLSYLSLPGDQNWLTNEAGIGILSFLDFPVSILQDPTGPVAGGCTTGSSADRFDPLFFILLIISIVTLVRREKHTDSNDFTYVSVYAV